MFDLNIYLNELNIDFKDEQDVINLKNEIVVDFKSTDKAELDLVKILLRVWKDNNNYIPDSAENIWSLLGKYAEKSLGFIYRGVYLDWLIVDNSRKYVSGCSKLSSVHKYLDKIKKYKVENFAVVLKVECDKVLNIGKFIEDDEDEVLAIGVVSHEIIQFSIKGKS